ncbi:MAG: hypothetical protein JWO31_3371 [Phycisphaerales bacterium]|nr:hypothetical protein [Phycisphaerales bacterium]
MAGMTADATLAYHTPTADRRPPARGWLATALLAGGLGLVFLAGCFLIGVMSVVSPGGFGLRSAPDRLTVHQGILVAVLYFCAGICLVTGLVVLAVASRTLLRLARS